MLFTKLNTSILIFKILHFLIKLTLKNNNKNDNIKDFCNILAFTYCIMLIYLLNINNNFLFFRKLQVYLII